MGIVRYEDLKFDEFQVLRESSTATKSERANLYIQDTVEGQQLIRIEQQPNKRILQNYEFMQQQTGFHHRAFPIHYIVLEGSCIGTITNYYANYLSIEELRQQTKVVLTEENYICSSIILALEIEACHQASFLQGDIHDGNLLVSGNDGIVIDFEYLTKIKMEKELLKQAKKETLKLLKCLLNFIYEADPFGLFRRGLLNGQFLSSLSPNMATILNESFIMCHYSSKEPLSTLLSSLSPNKVKTDREKIRKYLLS